MVRWDGVITLGLLVGRGALAERHWQTDLKQYGCSCMDGESISKGKVATVTGLSNGEEEQEITSRYTGGEYCEL